MIMTADPDIPDVKNRQRWMGVLSKAPPTELDAALEAVGGMPQYRYVRPPEFGSVLLRGRIGGNGSAFNFGEATMTRCTLHLAAGGPMGFGYVLGRNKRHAEIAAIFDALLQTGNDKAQAQVDLLELGQSTRDAREAAATASSKVDFFVLARE
jgi:alpha-D-ribose 1-methylphosphonate 5-triphosphate synthase subunit PhnG